MTVSYFVSGYQRSAPEARVGEAQRLELADRLAQTPRLQRVEIGVPAGVQTYHGDGPGPVLALRLDFAGLPDLEAAIDEGGHLYRLARSALWQTLPIDEVTQQAMLRRSFLDRLQGRASGCDYQVHYPGRAEDFDAWLRYYLAHHPQIMRDYPQVQAVDVFTRLDWCDAMPWQRVAYMQRNRLAFGSPEQLLAALESPVRDRMRQDHGQFPAYAEGSRHYAMAVTRLATDESITGSMGKSAAAAANG